MTAGLYGAGLTGANLEEAGVKVEQFRQAQSLRGATLPDGTRLSPEGWEAEWAAWAEGQADKIALCKP